MKRTDPAYPILLKGETTEGDFLVPFPGMDIRTAVASRQLAALLSNPTFQDTMEGYRASAIKHADGLLDRLGYEK